jgi:hypothetical protein
VSLTYLLVNHVVLLAVGAHLGRDFEPIPGPIPEQVGHLRRWVVLVMQPLLRLLTLQLGLWYAQRQDPDSSFALMLFFHDSPGIDQKVRGEQVETC